MNSGTILFVDDDPQVLSTIRKELRREPYQLVFASSGDDALKILSDRHKEIDVIVSDYSMPGMNGLELLTTVKDRYPSILRLFLSGQNDFKLAIDAINEGEVFRFIPKPWDNMEILLTLKYVFQFIEVIRENKLLKHELDKQHKILRKLEAEHPGISQVNMDDTGTFVVLDIDDKDL